MIGQGVAYFKILEHLHGGGVGVLCNGHGPKLDRLIATNVLPSDFKHNPEAAQDFDRGTICHDIKAASVIVTRVAAADFMDARLLKVPAVPHHRYSQRGMS